MLLGGGHSHVEVLRSFGAKPLPGVRLTLVTRDLQAPYSGMLPGYISGHYSFQECHINLGRLAGFARATLVHAEACGLDIKVGGPGFGASGQRAGGGRGLGCGLNIKVGGLGFVVSGPRLGAGFRVRARHQGGGV